MAYDPLLARIDQLSGAFNTGQIDRRQFLKGLVGLGLSLPAISVIVAACSTAATPSPAALASATAVPATLRGRRVPGGHVSDGPGIGRPDGPHRGRQR